jgi:hypothetical protein
MLLPGPQGSFSHRNAARARAYHRRRD